jgi:tetratricopeptide (TPR) repeat protein
VAAVIRASLPAIIALARAGAADQAWQLFTAAGHDRRDDDAAALSVKGRLLKDRALRARGEERLRLYSESAAAYRRAAEVGVATYPLINAASLSFLAGDRAEAAALAEQVLSGIEARPDEPETPYYRAATRAEALLLLGRPDEARAAFAEAIRLAPRAWEDHASTLRQFDLILAAQRHDASWLDSHRPPRSLHFGGHMSFDPKVVRRAHLDERIASTLEDERVGFGYGALAAGADIIIAEALLARGAELHAVLPGGARSFAEISVDPFGKTWRKRFDAVLERAETVRPVRPVGATPDAATIALADEIAMGAALMNARRLESRAVQLLVVADGASERTRDAWAEGGWRQRILAAPREAVAEAPPAPDRGRRRLAVLALATEAASAAELEARLGRIGEAVAALPPPAVGPYLADGAITLAFATALDGARAALRLAAEAGPGLPVRIGGDYAVAEGFRDPFSASERLRSDGIAAAAGALAAALPGTAYITEDFAAALAAAGPEAPHSEYIGELDPRDSGPPMGLHVLKS